MSSGLTKEDRDDFLKRVGAVQKLRRDGSEEPGVSVSEEQEWSDEGIEMLIAFGF